MVCLISFTVLVVIGMIMIYSESSGWFRVPQAKHQVKVQPAIAIVTAPSAPPLPRVLHAINPFVTDSKDLILEKAPACCDPEVR